MKFLFDLFPVILFFIAYKIHGIFVATAIAIAATVLQIGWAWFRHRHVDAMLWMTFAIIVVFGGATLLLHNETFIKLKPTVLYWALSIALLIAEFFAHKNPLKAMLRGQIELPASLWRRLLLAWAGFFVVMGILNLYVAFSFSTNVWVDFKLFGSTGLLLVFILMQALVLSKYVEIAEHK